MASNSKEIANFDWCDVSSDTSYFSWREAKIAACQANFAQPAVQLDSLRHPESAAISEIRARCATCNFAVYQVAHPEPGLDADCQALAAFAETLGFHQSEAHRSAGRYGVVALRTSDAPAQKGYIPYTSRPLNWHTDGYYNPASNPVSGFILHCHRQAAKGGENQFVDPELAYLRMRDENPDFVVAMMHPQAMTIPENREPNGKLRPVSIGPVFYPDPVSGRLQMRYTARTRSIEWRDDPTTLAAAAWLRDWLGSNDPFIIGMHMQPGQGIVSNNALHNRTGFDDQDNAARVMLRMRFHERLAEDQNGPAE